MIEVKQNKTGAETMKFTTTITFNKDNGRAIKESFASIPDAKKNVRKLCKQYGLSRQFGFWGNPIKNIELVVNF